MLLCNIIVIIITEEATQGHDSENTAHTVVIKIIQPAVKIGFIVKMSRLSTVYNEQVKQKQMK